MTNDMRRIMQIMEDGYINRAFDASTLGADRLKALAAEGYDTSQVLYHGSESDFEVFDPQYLRTADHFYTTPDPNTAATYGSNIYACFGKLHPQADLTDDSPESSELLRKIGEAFADDWTDAVETDESVTAVRDQIVAKLQQDDPDMDELDARWDAEADDRYKEALRNAAIAYVIEMITAGDGRLHGVRGRLQNDVMNECFGNGYKSVYWFDPNSTGQSLSVTFAHASDVVIIGKL